MSQMELRSKRNDDDVSGVEIACTTSDECLVTSHPTMTTRGVVMESLGELMSNNLERETGCSTASPINPGSNMGTSNPLYTIGSATIVPSPYLQMNGVRSPRPMGRPQLRGMASLPMMIGQPEGQQE